MVTGETPLLVTDSVSVRIGDRSVISDVSLELGSGGVVAVLGESGSGKTTLLSCLGGLRTPTTGSIHLLGHELTGLSAARRARLRLDSIGFVFQHADLLPELTPVENVMLPALLAGVDPDAARTQSDRLITDLGIRTAADTSVLSGGEAQRLALARAVVAQPRLLLADEPTGSLDGRTRDEVLDLMFGLVNSHDMGMVVVTHDPTVAARADHTLSLDSGVRAA